MKLHEIHAEGEEPIVVHLVRTLLKKGKEVRTWVVRGGDGYEVIVDDIQWDEKWPHVVTVEYSIQKRSGDYLNGQEYEFNAEGLVINKDKRGDYWLSHESDLNENLETIGVDILEKLLDKGERIWVSRQGRVGQGVLKGIRRASESIDGEHYFDVIELEVDVQPTKDRDHWRTNWWTISAEQFGQRVNIKKHVTARPGAGQTQWHVTVLQPSKVKEGVDTLGSLGWDMIVKKLKAGELVSIKKETLAELFSKVGQRGWDMTVKRHALLERVEAKDNRDYPLAHFLVPSKTAHWQTASIEMGPEQQENWLMEKFHNGWLAWRDTDLNESQIVGVADMVEHLISKGKPVAFMGIIGSDLRNKISHTFSEWGTLSLTISSVKRHVKARSPLKDEKAEYVIFKNAGGSAVWIMEDELDNYFKLEPLGHGYQIVNV